MLAWLQVTPDKANASRYEMYGQQHKLPTLKGVEHLADWLHDVGWYQSGAMGPVPTGYTEIKHWSDMTGAAPTKTEALMLRKASRMYVSQYNSSKDPQTPPPVQVEMSKSAVVEAFKNFGKRG